MMETLQIRTVHVTSRKVVIVFNILNLKTSAKKYYTYLVCETFCNAQFMKHSAARRVSN
jgi:hypothetical protein